MRSSNLRRVVVAAGIAMLFATSIAEAQWVMLARRAVGRVKVSPLGDDLTHLLITSAHTGNRPNAATMVMNSVLRVCKEMNVQCSPAK